MTRREVVIAAIAFVCGIVVAFAPAWSLGHSAGRDQAGALRSPGADPSAPAGADEATQDPSGEPLSTLSAAPATPEDAASAPADAGQPAAGAPASCPKPTITVKDGKGLAEALAGAAPGDVIEMADGLYDGNFVTTTSGTADAPIYLCGGAGAVLDGEGFKGGYIFHLNGADHWRLMGFTLTNGQKGVMADGTVGSVIQGLTIHAIGDEALHLRGFSTDNLVKGNTIYDTGNRREKFGEGVYIGTAESNWCDITNCEPDRSDRNVVEGNVIYDVTAEAVDLKEGTTGGIVRGNSFDGSSVTKDGADSWVDVKGNGWTIENNTGVNSPLDGFQVHEILDGWGKGNRFKGNTATVNGSGFGFSLTPAQDNVVECSNTVTGAKEGYSNVSCR